MKINIRFECHFAFITKIVLRSIHTTFKKYNCQTTSFSPQGIPHFKVGGCSPSECLNLHSEHPGSLPMYKPIIDTEHVSRFLINNDFAWHAAQTLWIRGVWMSIVRECWSSQPLNKEIKSNHTYIFVWLFPKRFFCTLSNQNRISFKQIYLTHRWDTNRYYHSRSKLTWK